MPRTGGAFSGPASGVSQITFGFCSGSSRKLAARFAVSGLNVMVLFSEGVVAPTGDIVAVPFQVPANAAGIAAPAVAGGADAVCDTVEAGLLALPVSELLPEPA